MKIYFWKNFFVIFVLCLVSVMLFLASPFFVNAQEMVSNQNVTSTRNQITTSTNVKNVTSIKNKNVGKDEDVVFQARVVDVLDEKERKFGDDKITQQVLKLIGLEGDFKGKEIIFNGISEVYTMKNKVYYKGDKVLVSLLYGDDGSENFYVIDNVRSDILLWLLGIFVVVVLIVGGFKGMRSLLALILTFTIVIKYIIPSILSGTNPIIPTLIGSFLILLMIIYLTEGINKRAHIAVVSIFISLIVVIVISYLFVGLAHLTGLNNENTMALIGLGKKTINFKGILLAGIILGSLGVLDDVVVSQVVSVEKIIESNPLEGRMEIFKKAYDIGISHISSMTNTLFLAYAGVSMSLLILFISGNSAFSSWAQIVSNEAIATEIVRTLSGSIGLVLAIPLSTAIAVWWLKK